MKFEVYYGVGKTTKAIRTAKIRRIFNKNKTYVYLPDKVWKPILATHDGETFPVSKELSCDKKLFLEPNSTIIIDEAQYLKPEALGILIEQSINKNVHVYCFCEFKKTNGDFTRIGSNLINVATNIKKVKLNKVWSLFRYIFKLIFRRKKNV